MSNSRFFYQLTPEYGVGYYLGIVGGCLMILLLAYPLKKRVRGAPLPLSAKFWFRTHMQLGVLGPALIVLHSKLNLGSTNSTVAFVFMMTIMTSGLIGRFLYQKIHVSLYGHRKDLNELLEKLKARIEEHIDKGLPVPKFLQDPSLGDERAAFDKSLPHLRAMRRSLRDPKVDVNNREQLRWLRKVDALLGQCISLVMYERLFSWWHYLHLPVFFAFLLATVVHIVAVHIY